MDNKKLSPNESSKQTKAKDNTARLKDVSGLSSHSESSNNPESLMDDVWAASASKVIVAASASAKLPITTITTTTTTKTDKEAKINNQQDKASIRHGKKVDEKINNVSCTKKEQGFGSNKNDNHYDNNIGNSTDDNNNNNIHQGKSDNNNNNNNNSNQQQVLPGSYAVEGVDGSTHFDILDNNNNNNNDYDNDNDNRNNNNNAEPNQQQENKSEFMVVAEIANDERLIKETEDRIKKELMVNVAHAEAVNEDEIMNQQQQQKNIIFGIIACLVIIGIVVGVVVGTMANRTKNQPASVVIVETTATPTTSFAPSFYPTNKPSYMPSAKPTNEPSSKPSQRPSLRPSSLPSSLPTIAPTNPNNEQCIDAISLNTARFVSGDLAFTQNEFISLNCFDERGATTLPYGRPRWYKFAGSSNDVTLRLCTSFDSLIDTYIVDTCADGSFCGDMLVAFKYEQSNVSNDCPHQTLIVLPFSLPGLTYRIMLYIPFDNIEGTMPPLPSSYPSSFDDSQYPVLSGYTDYTLELTQSNYFCEGATFIFLTSPIPSEFNFVGTTLGARMQPKGQCGNMANDNNNNQTVPGVWYKIPGAGDIYTYSTCDDSSSVVHQISVYESDLFDTCANSKCITGSNDGCKEPVTWHARGGYTYFVLVSSATEIGGSFTLTPISARPAVFDCIGAIELDSSLFEAGMLHNNFYQGNVDDSDERSCQFVDTTMLPDANSRHGVWWKFQGIEGGTIEVASCNDISTSMGLSVFVGSNNDDCNEIECVASLAGCEFGEFGDSISFVTNATKTYYIRAFGDRQFLPTMFGFSIVNVTL